MIDMPPMHVKLLRFEDRAGLYIETAKGLKRVDDPWLRANNLGKYADAEPAAHARCSYCSAARASDRCASCGAPA